MTAPAPYSHRSHTTTDRHVNGQVVKADARKAEIQAMVDEWNAANPEIATPFGRENLARANVFPTIHGGESLWLDRFTADPDLMWLLIGDIVRYVSSEEFDRGSRTSSRRQVQPQHRNMDAVWRIIGPRFSLDPFPVALKEIVGKRSLRDIGVRAGFGSSATLRRYVNGSRPLTMDVLEAISKACRVEPFFFVEYRAMWLARELQRAFLARANESIRAVQRVRSAVV